MNRTYGLFFFIVKNTMFILNVIIVLFYVAVIAIQQNISLEMIWREVFLIK